MTSKDIAERNQGKLIYSLKVLKYIEKSFRDIHNKQRISNTFIPVTKIYRQKVIEVVDDFVYFNQALLDMTDFQAAITNMKKTLETEALSDDSNATNSIKTSISSDVESNSDKVNLKISDSTSGVNALNETSPKSDQHRMNELMDKEIVDSDGLLNLD